MLRHIKPGMLVFSVLYILLGLLLLLAPQAVADVFCIALGLLVVLCGLQSLYGYFKKDNGSIRTAVTPVLKFLFCSVNGLLADVRKLVAPCLGGLIKSLLDGRDHSICFAGIATAQCLGHRNKTITCLLYAPVTIIADVFLSLDLGLLVNLDILKHIRKRNIFLCLIG